MVNEQTPLFILNKDDDGRKEPLLSVTFHVEIFRVIGTASFILTMAICIIISNLFIFDTGIFGFGWGDMDPESTTIFGLYGFNHLCNNMDFNPARLVAAILIPIGQVSMVLYVFFFYLRVYRSYKQGIVGYRFLTYSRVTSVYNVMAFLQLHLVTVNIPDGDYGFLGHYIPFIVAQIAFAFMAISQVHYLKAHKDLPWGIEDWMADAYVGFLIVLTLMSHTFGLAIAFKHPILDSKNNLAHRLVFRTMADMDLILSFFVPIIFAIKHLENGDVHTVTYD